MREFMGDHHRLASNLLQRLERERAALAEALVKGTGADTFDQYRHNVGRIDGLDLAISLCKQIQTQL